MAESLNAAIADKLVGRQLQVSRAEARQRREIWAILALLEADLLAALRLADPTQYALLTRRQRAVEDLMAEDIEPLVTTRYDRLATMATAFLVALAQQEVTATQRLVGEVTDEPLVEEDPSDRAVRRGVTATLIPSVSKPTDLSTTGADWWARQSASLVQRVGDTLQTSVSLEESLTQAQARIRGTQTQGFSDGVMAKARQDAARLLTTQTTNATSEAHVALAAANAEQAILVHVSILDSRTSLQCTARHGLKYTADESHTPIGHDIPYLNGVPYHPSCVPGDTKVLTQKGWRAIAEVHAGMSVLSHRGRWCTVMQTMCQRNNSGVLRCIHTDTGRVLLATQDHPILGAGIGWLRMDHVQIGNQCFEYRPDSMQIPSTRMACFQGNGMPQKRPTVFEQGLCADRIMSDAFGTGMCFAVDFQADLDGREGKIHDIDPDGVLKDKPWECVGIEHFEQHLFAGRRIATQVLCTACTHANHGVVVCGRVGLGHALTMSLEEWARLFAQPITPMVFSSWPIGFAFGGRSIDTHALFLRAYCNTMPFTPPTKTCYGYTIAAFNGSQRSPLFPMLLLNELCKKCFVTQVNCHNVPPFMASTIISIEEVGYNDFVYNLAVEEDESYIANGLVVHNCRSQLIPGTRDGGPIPKANLDTWLLTQSKAFQDDLLGPKRAQLWREGKLGSTRDLLDATSGRPLTLEELGS